MDFSVNSCTQKRKYFASFREKSFSFQLPHLFRSHVVFSVNILIFILHCSSSELICINVHSAIKTSKELSDSVLKVKMINRKIMSTLPSTMFCSINFASGHFNFPYNDSYHKSLLFQRRHKHRAKV